MAATKKTATKKTTPAAAATTALPPAVADAPAPTAVVARKPKAKGKGKTAIKPKAAITKTTAEGEPVALTAARRHKKNYASYAAFIYRLLKQIYPDVGISNKAMSVIESFVQDMFERLAVESARLARLNKVKTIRTKEIQTAVRLLIGGELAQHGGVAGLTAVTKYQAAIQTAEAEAEAAKAKNADGASAQTVSA